MSAPGFTDAPPVTFPADYLRGKADFITTMMCMWGRLLPASVKAWMLAQQREAYAQAQAQDEL
jgi:hypothetical protein